MTTSIQKDALLSQFSVLAYEGKAYLEYSPIYLPAGSWLSVRSMGLLLPLRSGMKPRVKSSSVSDQSTTPLPAK